MAIFNLERFVSAQDGVYAQALAELRRGRKDGHWIWFVFPQIAGLGHSANAWHFGVRGLAEAQAYLAHPMLGARLRECTEAVLAHRGQPAEAIFGTLDAMKFRSSMTLFEAAAPNPALFTLALETFCAGERDPLTLARLAD